MSLESWKHRVSMTDPKYLPMMGLPMVVPYLMHGPPQFWILLGGVVAVVALNWAAVLVNTLKDREADRLNFPAGESATERFIGYRRLRLLIAVAYLVVLAATVTMWVFVSKQVAVIYALGWLIATVYSVGPRLKRSLVLSRLAIACGPALAFIGGWALRADLRTLPAAVVLLFVGQGVHILLKDLPDAEGDRRAGVRTLFTGLDRSSAVRVLLLLWTLPYLLVAVGGVAGIWPARFQLLWALYPLALLTVRSVRRAATSEERELVREIAQVYSTSYVLTILLLIWPSAVNFGLMLGAAIYYALVLELRIDRRRQGHGLARIMAFASGQLFASTRRDRSDRQE